MNGEEESIPSYIPAALASHGGRSRRWTTFRIARFENSKSWKVFKDVRDVFENPMFHDPQNWTIINLGTKDQEAVPLLAVEC